MPVVFSLPHSWLMKLLRDEALAISIVYGIPWIGPRTTLYLQMFQQFNRFTASPYFKSNIWTGQTTPISTDLRNLLVDLLREAFC